MTVTVDPVNDAPSFTKGPDQTVSENAGGQSVANWATDISIGPSNESSNQTPAFQVTNDNNALFAIQPDISAGGELTYTPANNTTGSAVVTVSLSDDGGTANGGSDTSADETFTITVNAVDDPPIAVDDAETLSEDNSVVIDVMANDTDIDGGPKSIDSVTQPAGGSVTITNGGADVTYQPNVNFCNDGSPTDDFTYTLTPGSSTATVAMTVTCINDAPIADNASATTNEDIAVTIALSGSDVDGDTLDFAIATGPSNGSLGTVSSTGPTTAEVTYTPAGDFNGSDSFTYRANDGTVDSALATVDITVDAVNDLPTASDDTLTVVAGSTATADVLANDDFGGDGPGTGAITIRTAPSDGVATVDDGGTPGDPTDDRIAYTPDSGFAGSDSLVYAITDANGDTATATLAIMVESADAGTPAAGDDVLTVAADNTATADVLANDTFGSDGPGTGAIEIITAPSDGTASVDDGGTPDDPTDDRIDYTPDAGFAGSDSLVYRIADADGDTAEATVSVTVNDTASGKPAVGDDVADVDEDDSVIIAVLANDDFGGDGAGTTAAEIIGGADNGTATVDDGGTPSDPTDDTVAYEPADDFFGTDAFDYRITDADGDTARGTVQITVAPVNDAPSFTAGADQTVDEDAGGQTVSGWATSISAGPTNESSQAVSFNVTNDNAALFSDQPAVSPSGTLSYTPDDDENGSASITVSLSDDGGTANGGEDTSGEQIFMITINAVNDAPQVDDDTATTDEDMPVTIDVLANDSDVDGNLDPATVQVVSGPSDGATTVNSHHRRDRLHT